jgi:hypothetical protein
MAARSISAIVDYLVSLSAARAGKPDGEGSSAADEYIAIFDELDSLTREEFAHVYAIYLIGSNRENEFGLAHRIAQAAGFLPLEDMAQDARLHVVLARGIEAHQHAKKG